MKKILLLSLVSLLMIHKGNSQSLENRHDPKIDFNLSPTFNSTLNPEKNSNINPKYNWNINPMHNNDVNPELKRTISPLIPFELNPDITKTLNRIYHNEYHPKNPSWKGLYIFNNTDELIGYVSVATQYLMLTFDSTGEWTGFYVRATPGI